MGKRTDLMGLDISKLIETLQAQNAIQPSGTVDAGDEKIAIRVSGQFTSEESLKAVNFRVNGRFFRLSDIAKVRRTYVDPQQPMFRYDGTPAIGLAISMTKNANVLEFGQHIKERLAQLTSNLPAGIELHLVADQPQVVEEAVGEFIKTLIEAIAIVLGVSFLSLGWRPGIVVAIAIPLVLAITFLAMKLTGISLQRISLGALIIGLGLLVDDAMIAVEMMITKLEEGCDKISAATFAYTSTAFPMLTGTLVTIAGFIPVGFAASGAGEYCFTLFAVVGVALVASWMVAVLFTPLTGVFVLPNSFKGHGHEPSRFARAFRTLLDRVLRVRYAVIGGTIALFIAALASMQLVQQQFFPSSDRPELLVDLTLPQGSSINATRKVVDEIEKVVKTDPDVERWSFYIGSGAIRFYLPLDQQLANDFFAQAVVVTKGFKARAGVQQRILAALRRPEFEQVLARVSPLELGPPVGWPLKFRVSGPDPTKVRELAHSFASLLGRTPHARNIHFDWNEPSKVVRVEVDQDRARSLGLSSQSLSETINAVLSGTNVTQVRDSIYLVDIVARAVTEERAKLETLRSLMIDTPSGRSVPLEQVANISYDLEPPLIWRRHRLPTVTVQAETAAGLEAATRRARARQRYRSIQSEASARLRRRCRRHGRRQRQGRGQYLRRVPAHAALDGHDSHGAAAELPAPVPGAGHGAAGADRCVRGAADLRRANGFRRHPRHGLPDRHGHPQLGDPDRPDRNRDRPRTAALGRRHRCDAAPATPDPFDGRRRHSRHDPDCTDGVLGTDGLRGDGRTGGRNAAHSGVPACALCGVVQDQAEFGTAADNSSRRRSVGRRAHAAAGVTKRDNS